MQQPTQPRPEKRAKLGPRLHPGMTQRGLYAGVSAPEGGRSGILACHPSCFSILRPWGAAVCGDHPAVLHVAREARGEGGSTLGGGVCIPFSGFEYDRDKVAGLRSILDFCSLPSVPRGARWNEDVIRMLSFWEFPSPCSKKVYLWDAAKGALAARPSSVAPVDSPPDYIPLPRRVRAGSEPAQPREMDLELAYLHAHLRDLSGIASMRGIRTGGTVYIAQAEPEGAFPAGLYAARIVCRISTSRPEVFPATDPGEPSNSEAEPSNAEPEACADASDAEPSNAEAEPSNAEAEPSDSSESSESSESSDESPSEA